MSIKKFTHRSPTLIVEAKLETFPDHDDVLQIYTRTPKQAAKQRQLHATVILPPDAMRKVGLLLVDGRTEAAMVANWRVVMHPRAVPPTEGETVRDHLTEQQALELAASMQPAKTFKLTALPT